MPLTRDQAQQRADDIQAFNRELQRLQTERALQLADDQRQHLEAHHRALLDELRGSFDVDHNRQTKRLSLSMRISSLLGALALAASLLFFFYQFWGLLGETAQVSVLVGFTFASLLIVHLVNRRDQSGYFTKLAAMLAFACFVLNITMLGQIFNVQPSDKALLPWAIFALLLAYGCEARLLLVAGLLCLLAYVAARIGTWGGGYWLSVGERPENFLPLALVLIVLPQFISQARFSGFAATYRLVGLIALFLPVLALANWGTGSYLPWDNGIIEGSYQLLGFITAALVIWIGSRREWPEMVNTGLTFFIIFLFTKLFDWWWEIMPKYLFFLIIGLIAVLFLLVLGRLRRRDGGLAR